MKSLKLGLFLLLILLNFAIAFNWHGTAIAPDGRKVWVVAIDSGLVLHSPNACTTWTNQSFSTPRYFWDVFFLNGQKGWIGTDQGFVYYTENGGSDWVQQAAGLSKHIARIFFFDDSCGWAACGLPIIAQTRNGGQDWMQIFLPPIFPIDTVDFYGVSFINRLTGWACAGRYPEYDATAQETLFTRGQGYIAKTIDGGDNWTLMKKDTIYDFFDIKFHDSLNGIVVGGNDRNNAGVVMRTQDGGNTWQTLTIPSQTKILRALKTVGNQHAWAVGRNGTIIKSSNWGSNWISQSSGVDTTLFDVDFADTLNGVIAGNEYVLYTHNSGANWHIANFAGIEENSALTSRQPHLKTIPNPFRQYTIIRVPSTLISIYDKSGKLVKTIRSNYDSQHTDNEFIWDGKDLNNRFVPSGVYFVRLVSDNQAKVIPIIFQK